MFAIASLPTTLRTCAVAVACLAFGSVCEASTVQTSGSVPLITSPDLSTSFSDLTSSHATGLDNYTNNGLSVTTASSSWGSDLPQWYLPLDPFHGANGSPPVAFYAMANASNDWVTIQTVGKTTMYAAEFMYGNTWTTGQISGPYPWGNSNAALQWQTFKTNVMVSSGEVPFLAMGTYVNFSDLDGFDQLLVQAVMNGTIGCPDGYNPPCTSPPWQAIALDNLNVQTTAPNVVPLPAALPLFATGLGALGLLGWRRKKKAPTAPSD